MTNESIIVAGTLFFSLILLGFLLTIAEFIQMKKHPNNYKKPRYKKNRLEE